MREVESVLDIGDKEKALEAIKEIIQLLEYYEELHPTGRAARWFEKKAQENILTTT